MPMTESLSAKAVCNRHQMTEATSGPDGAVWVDGWRFPTGFQENEIELEIRHWSNFLALAGDRVFKYRISKFNLLNKYFFKHK